VTGTARACAIAAHGAMLVALTGCPKSPPPSLMPNAEAALDRMKASATCGVGVGATDAKIDHFGEHGRVRAELDFYAFLPARLRLDVQAPMSAGVLATLTSDGERFALSDLREKRFLFGPANACNIARLTTVAIPGHALVSLLRGQAPVLKHDATRASVRWDGGGYYVVSVPSTRDALEEIHLEPHPDDFTRPWGEQRMRVRKVIVRQYGDVLYDAELDGHRRVPTGEPIVDAAGIDPPVPPSGPACSAELPHTIHVTSGSAEVIFVYDHNKVVWNPALPLGADATFTQEPQPGLALTPVRCE
jgi:hypothetical protein